MKVEDVVTGVAKLWAPPPRQTVCEWAQENFIVTTGANKGRFRPAPYQVEPINAIGDPAINEIVIMSATQLLKTITILVGISYVIARDPDPIMVVMPRDSDVGKFSKFRLAPMLREMPALRGLVSDPKSRNSSTTIDTKDFPGGPLIMTAAGSPGNLAAYAIRYLFCDEVDKYPKSSGGEGNPIDVANKRTATYRGRRKRIQTCSPTIARESQIAAAYAETDQRKFWVPGLWQSAGPGLAPGQVREEVRRSEEARRDGAIRVRALRCAMERRPALVGGRARRVARRPAIYRRGRLLDQRAVLVFQTAPGTGAGLPEGERQSGTPEGIREHKFGRGLGRAGHGAGLEAAVRPSGRLRLRQSSARRIVPDRVRRCAGEPAAA
jgi:hypothetical protein